MFAIWIPMMAGDARSAWDSNVLDDPRVTEFWDGKRIAGTWFGRQQGVIAWDVYYAFGGRSTWTSPPIATGTDIIDHVSGLEQSFIPLLRR